MVNQINFFRKIALIIVFMSSVILALSQTVIYSTNFGTANSTTATLQTGWVRSGAQASNLTLNTSSASSGYTNPSAASGGANLADGASSSVAGTAIVTCSGLVNTTGYSSIQVLWTARKTSAYTGTVTFEWSADGSTWNPVTFTEVPNTSTWTAVNGGTWLNLASGAENVSNLQFRFTLVRTNTSGNYRMDDFTVRGVSASPTVSAGAITPMYTTVGTPSNASTFIVSGTNLSTDLLVTAPAGFEVRTGSNPYASTVTLSPISGTVGSTNIDIRLTGATVGLYSANVVVSSTGASNVTTTAQGTVVGSTVGLTTGNLVLLQIGNGTSAVTSSSTAVYVREMTTSGTFVQLLSLPTADSGNNQSFTNSGTATSEGAIALSPNGQYLAFAGYDAAPGVANINSATGVNRVVATINKNGEINTSKVISDGFTGNNVRGAVTSNGYDFWVTGAGTGGGVRYTNLSSSTSTLISGTLNNTRGARIFDGQLYISSATSPNIGVSKVGTGLPTATAVLSLTSLTPASTDTYAFVFLDRDAGVAGSDVLYIADNTLGLLKYSFDGTAWTSRGSLTGTGFTGLIGKVNGANADLYISTGTAVYAFTDAAAFDANITSSGSAITTAGTVIATAFANMAFRGIEFAPSAAPDCPFYVDADGDGFGSSTVAFFPCSGGTPVGHSAVTGDCDDTNNAIYPGAVELACNSIDDNCTAGIDENFVTGCNDPIACNYSALATCAVGCDYTAQTWYEDADGDNYGSTAVTQTACTQPVGYILIGGDCDDTNNAINPGAIEDACDGIDNNCAAGIDENRVVGCMDPSALNYNASANCTSVGCVYPSGFGQGNLVVYRIGDGAAALTSAAQRTFFDEFNTSSTGQTPAASFNVPYLTAGSRLVNSGTATSEGQISRSPDGTSVVFAGYDAAVGTTSINGSSSATNPRVIGRLSLSGTASIVASGTFYNTNNVRSAATDGTNYWAGGNSGNGGQNGVCYLGPGTDAQVSNAPVSNVRTVRVDNGQLYFSTASGTIGIYAVGSGLPITSGQTQTLVVPFATSTDGYDFEFNDNMTICYVADARTNGSGGVQKYTFNGSAWTLAYTASVGTSAGASSIYVDWFSEASPVIYATRIPLSGATALVKFTDSGIANPAVTVLATAPTNQVFRGVELAPCNGITWYRDADGDGFGDATSTLVNCTQPFGYVLDNTDCDDNSILAYPGAVEVCNNADDDCDFTIDESCIYPPNNDNRVNAFVLTGMNAYPACNFTSASLAQATISLDAQSVEPLGAGQDVWYRFVSTTGSVRLTATSAVNDLVIELQNNTGTVIEIENSTTTGSEILNISGLTVGATYYVAIRNFNTSSVGLFTFCAQNLSLPTSTSPASVNNMCSTIKCQWTGASSYTATLTDGTNTYSYTSTSTKMALTLFGGLTYNTNYTLTYTATYNLVDGAGNPEVITVTSAPASLAIGQPQEVQLRSTDMCSNQSRALNSFVSADLALCGINRYEWEFIETDINNVVTGAPIYVLGQGTSRYMQLNGVNIPGIQAGDYYRVKIRAVYTGGQSPWPSTYRTLCVTGVAPGMTEESNEEVAWVNADAAAVVYPNPNNGDMFNLNVNGLSDGVWNVQVLDVQGRIVHTEQVVAEGGINRTISMNNTLSNGLYTVRLMNGEAALNVRMIVE